MNSNYKRVTLNLKIILLHREGSIKIKNLNTYDSSLLYRTGNTIDLDKLLKTFPFN